MECLEVLGEALARITIQKPQEAHAASDLDRIGDGRGRATLYEALAERDGDESQARRGVASGERLGHRALVEPTGQLCELFHGLRVDDLGVEPGERVGEAGFGAQGPWSLKNAAWKR